MTDTDPATDPATELDRHPQDLDVDPDWPTILHRVISRLRVLAGRRGHAEVSWQLGGFSYTLSTTRLSPPPRPHRGGPYPPGRQDDPEDDQH
jgi:hypothetical protein